MAITRRTPGFAQIAKAVEEQLADSNVTLEPPAVDEAVNAELDRLAHRLGVTPRTALGYAPGEDFATWIAIDVGNAIIDTRRRQALHVVS